MSRIRRVTTEAVAVAPELTGRELAPPWRRAVALLVDLALLAVPTLVVAAGAAALSLRLGDPAAWAALRTLARERPDAARTRALACDVAPALVRAGAPGLPVDLLHAVEHGDCARVGELMAGLDFLVVFGRNDTVPRPGQVVVQVQDFIPTGARALAVFGVPALYFTLAHRGRRGRTLGKRLLGIAVARLDGRPLGLLGSLERFGGYFGVAGTVGVGIVELWRHPLRQLGHDRGAGTVVLLEPRRSRRGRAAREVPARDVPAEPVAAAPAPPAAPEAAEGEPATAP